MSEWRTYSLGEVTRNFDSLRVPVKSAERVAGPYPYYGASGVVDRVEGFLFDGEFLLIAEDGENLRTRKTPIAFMAEGRFWVNNHAHVVQGNHLANTRFLCYVLSGTDISGHLSGSTQPKLTQASLNAVRVKLPDRARQDAVVDVLRALDDKIDVNERIATTYEQLLQCRYAELGLAEEPNPETAVAITDLVTFNPKLAKPAVDEPVYVDMAALQTHLASIPTWTRRAPKSGPRFMNGDTLLARITPCLENGKTGYVDFMKDGEIGLGSTEFIVMRSVPGVPSELSYFLARDSRFRAHAIRNMVGTSGRQRVSAADAANYQVNRPDADALAAFGEEASTAFAHMKSLQAENRALATLRDTLLPQLMSGRLRIKDAEKIVEDAT
ncbi:restriction endonuclease subunit S [Streptomyces sp. NPDC093808]|uniref:restriction endonuclease subunit S n=1 Tax=unclassified Streptomyces TaxID=2593676 RepID=UPI00344FC479